MYLCADNWKDDIEVLLYDPPYRGVLRDCAVRSSVQFMTVRPKRKVVEDTNLVEIYSIVRATGIPISIKKEKRSR